MDEENNQKDTHAWMQEGTTKFVAERQKNKTKNYWQKLLSGFVNPSVLGIKKNLVEDSTQPVYGVESISFSPELAAQIKYFLQAHQLTLGALLQGVWGYLLSRYSGNDDVVFGSALSNAQTDLSPMRNEFGLSINTIPIRIQIKPTENVCFYLQRLQLQLLESRYYEFASLEDIKNWSELPQSFSLLDHIFLLENYATEGVKKLNSHAFPYDAGDVQLYKRIHYTLSVIAAQTDQLWIKINFDENQYSKLDIQRLLRHYHELLKSFIAFPERLLKDLSFLTTEERQQILVDWNQTHSDYPRDKTIHQLIEEQVEKIPNHIALIFQGDTLTYNQLNEKANQLAHYLQKCSVQANTPVAICMEPSADLMVAILAVLKAGGAYVPLDPNYPAERLQFMLHDTQAKIIITQSTLINCFKERGLNNLLNCFSDGMTSVTGQNVAMPHGEQHDLESDLNHAAINNYLKLIFMDEHADQLAKYPITNLAKVNNAESLAYIIYTSGSTGKPKGVMITHRNVNHFIHWFSNALPISNKDIFDFSSSISFDFSVPNTLFPIVKGAKVAICPELNKKDPHLYIDHLLENRVTFIKITPSYFRQLKGFVTSEHKFSALRYIVFGGETSFAKDIKDWLAKFPHHLILNEYGPTEATVATSWLIVDKNNINNFKNNIPIGKPALNSQLYILNKDLQPLPIGITGELYIGGEGVAKGYLNRAEVTAEKFINDLFCDDPSARLYKTGDLCRYLPDGNIEFIGRIDHQVKIRGFRIETGEIETCLILHPLVKEAIVLVREDEMGEMSEKQLIAYCVVKEMLRVPSVHELRQYLQEHLPDYMIPTVFVILDAFPLSPNGKLDRNALPVPTLPINQRYIAPSTALEQTVAEIWSNVLNLKQISVDNNFFELGGNSLSAARIISKIERVKNKEMKLQDIYDAPTIKELSIIINNAKYIDTPKNQKKLGFDSKYIPLSDMQFILWLMQKFYPVTKGLNIVDRRRVSGMLDIQSLKFSLECICRKHEILCYQLSKYIPVQYQQEKTNFKIIEKDLSQLSSTEKEMELFASLKYLKRFSSWKKESPLIIVVLFNLGNNTSELQISMPHIVSDEVSPEIIFADLSAFYLSYKKNGKLNNFSENVQYKDYILLERDHLETNLDRDTEFWEEYLKNTDLFTLPSSVIVKDKEIKNTLCTTYFSLPEKELNNLQTFCVKNRLSMTDSLCAAVGLSLVNYLDTSKNNNSKIMAINCVKSTRNNDIYDNTIGFFVRTDLIRMDMSDSPNFVELSKRIQKSVMETTPYQASPVIMKLAFLFKKHWQNKKIGILFIKMFIILYEKIFYNLKLNRNILMMYGRMFLAEKRKNFLVEVNIFNNFITNNHKKNNLFGLKLQQVSNHHEEKMSAKNILDICFARDNQNKAYLIVSGNLKSYMREQIGKDIIKHICRKTSEEL